MKIYAFSDIHLESAPFEIDRGALEAADVVVAAGDLGNGTQGVEWLKTLGKPVAYSGGRKRPSRPGGRDFRRVGPLPQSIKETACRLLYSSYMVASNTAERFPIERMIRG